MAAEFLHEKQLSSPIIIQINDPEFQINDPEYLCVYFEPFWKVAYSTT